MVVKIASDALKIVSLKVRGISNLKKNDPPFSHGVAERMQT